MKVKRLKKASRTLSFFQQNFGHRQPFQVLVDGTFCQACLAMKINIRDQLSKYLGDVKLLTTKCCIIEAEKLGPALYGATLILKQFKFHECGHNDPKPAMKCIKSMIGQNNQQRYFVATQDPELRAKVRQIAGTPILYLHHCAPTLEKPSEASSVAAAEKIDRRMTGTYHSQVVNDLKRKTLGDAALDQPPVKKAKKIKGPNPLSCLKKKTAKKGTAPPSEDSKAAKTRKRPRKRKRKPLGADAKCAQDEVGE